MLEAYVKADGVRLRVRIATVVQTQVSVTVCRAFRTIVHFRIVSLVICYRQDILSADIYSELVDVEPVEYCRRECVPQGKVLQANETTVIDPSC